jgi:hypothetical protein
MFKDNKAARARLCVKPAIMSDHDFLTALGIQSDNYGPMAANDPLAGALRKDDDRTCTLDTPKFTGSHRRWGRPFGELSSFHSTVAVILVLLVIAVFFTVLVMMKKHVP